MIDLDNFYKFEIGIGILEDNKSYKFAAYALLPDGTKVVAHSQEVGAWGDDDAKDQLRNTLMHVLMQLESIWSQQLHEQSKQE